MGQNKLVQPLTMKHQRNLVDGVFDVLFLNDRLDRNIAEAGNLLPGFAVDRVFAAANKDLRLDADLAEFGHALLGGLRLQFARRLDERDEGHVDEEAVAGAGFQGKLAQGLEKRKAFDIPGCAADFRDEHIAILILTHQAKPAFDLLGDMGDDLDGFSEIIPAPLLAQHLLINLSRGKVVTAGQSAGGEALIMAQIKVRLRAVLQDIDLPVLVGAHRAGVDVQVGIKFHQAHPQTATLQEGAEGGGGETLAQGTDNPAGDKNIFHVEIPVARSARARSARVTSPGVSTPTERKVSGTTWTAIPFSRARSCSSFSRFSPSLGGRETNLLRVSCR